MLRAHAVHVAFGPTLVLNDVSLAIAPREVVAVLGPNGVGKSTLLAVLSGVLTPRRGSVTLDDRPLAAWSPTVLACRRAVLLQQAQLAFSFSALEVVLLGRSPHGGRTSRERNLAMAEAALLETGTAHLADRLYTTLSGGEQQRVQLARILAQIDFTETTEMAGERYLLLDEPIASLDPAHQHATLETARRAADRGMGVLAILHDLNLAAMYADRIVVLHEGRIAAEGPPGAAMTEETLRRTFDLNVSVARHPTRDCPHIIAISRDSTE